jgi:hypothetical protein
MKKKFNDFDASPLYTVPKFDDIPMSFNNKKAILKKLSKDKHSSLLFNNNNNKKHLMTLDNSLLFGMPALMIYHKC